MRHLYLLGSLLALAACAPQPAPPAASAPPPAQPVYAAPPPAMAPPPPVRVSFDGRYAGALTLAASGMSQTYENRSGCVSQRPATMVIRNGNVFLEYANWKRHKLHYRGRVDPGGAVTAYHTNSDGSRSILSGQISNGQMTGDMQRGPCNYAVSLAMR
jgi:hypothetical protein